MESLRSFYQSTYYFWLTSRIIFILLFLISFFSIISEGNLKKPEILFNGAIAIYIVLLTVIAYNEISKSQSSAVLKIIVGLFSILFGLFLIGMLLFYQGATSSGGLKILGLTLGFWFFTLGVKDVIRE